jgi:vacuolar-type H+-ATPase subunit H
VSSSDRTVRRREIEDSTAARLAEIVASAEKAAKQVIDEAEEEARSRIADATEEADRIVAERLAGLAELTDEINAQAESLKRQAATLQRALAEAKAGLGGSDASDPPSLMGRRASDLDPEPDFEPGLNGGRKPLGPALSIVGSRAEEEPAGDRRGEAPEADGEPGGNGTPAGARLLATQMAVSGSSRAEIEARLRNGFAISDTRAILDAILGPEN